MTENLLPHPSLSSTTDKNTGLNASASFLRTPSSVAIGSVFRTSRVVLRCTNTQVGQEHRTALAPRPTILDVRCKIVTFAAREQSVQNYHLHVAPRHSSAFSVPPANFSVCRNLASTGALGTFIQLSFAVPNFGHRQDDLHIGVLAVRDLVSLPALVRQGALPSCPEPHREGEGGTSDSELLLFGRRSRRGWFVVLLLCRFPSMSESLAAVFLQLC